MKVHVYSDLLKTYAEAEEVRVAKFLNSDPKVAKESVYTFTAHFIESEEMTMNPTRNMCLKKNKGKKISKLATMFKTNLITKEVTEAFIVPTKSVWKEGNESFMSILNSSGR